MTPCPSERALLAYVSDGTGRDPLEEHVASCEKCRRAVVEIARATSFDASDGEAAPTLAPSAHVGRYLLGAVIGSGGMGTVHRGWDPTLGRPVAIKRLHRCGGSPDRLLHEARAMGRITHPHVVPVFDAGIADGAVYLVAELVPGVTLRTWTRDRSRSAERVATVFAEVAEGLAAAHDAGLLHRDMKPDNVLIDATGRARVTDFGLSVDDGDERARGLAGTRGYLAPEILTGGPATAASDQYAFFVTLEECLPSKGGSVLRRIVKRGRANEPAARFPSMHEVAQALRAVSRPRPARAPFAAAGFGAAVVLAIAWVGTARSAPTQVHAELRARDYACTEKRSEGPPGSAPSAGLPPARASGGPAARGPTAAPLAPAPAAATAEAAFIAPMPECRRLRDEVCGNKLTPAACDTFTALVTDHETKPHAKELWVHAETGCRLAHEDIERRRRLDAGLMSRRGQACSRHLECNSEDCVGGVCACSARSCHDDADCCEGRQCVRARCQAATTSRSRQRDAAAR